VPRRPFLSLSHEQTRTVSHMSLAGTVPSAGWRGLGCARCAKTTSHSTNSVSVKAAPKTMDWAGVDDAHYCIGSLICQFLQDHGLAAGMIDALLAVCLSTSSVFSASEPSKPPSKHTQMVSMCCKHLQRRTMKTHQKCRNCPEASTFFNRNRPDHRAVL